MATLTKKKKPQMTENLSSHPLTHRYYADPAAHLAHQTSFTKTGQLNMINRKPTVTRHNYRGY